MLIPSLLAKGLTRVLDESRKDRARSIDLPSEHKYVIFSDHHKGAETPADDFKFSKPTYKTALDYYNGLGYTLIILGDAEELWEEPIEDVIEKHHDVLESEARFHADGRYMRIFGNHDNNWASKGQVKDHLHKFFPDLEVHEGLVFHYQDADPENSGDVFLVHGHQGTLDSEYLTSISRVLVRGIWRTTQLIFGNTGTTPSKSADLRGQHDTLMYQWAREQKKLILIAGHTHRSIWSSRTMLEQKNIELEALEIAETITHIPDDEARRIEARRIEAKKEIQELLKVENNQLKKDTLKTEGCYFNSGCCSFKEGQVTGYELVDNELKLVRWLKNSQEPESLGQAKLGNIFFLLD